MPYFALVDYDDGYKKDIPITSIMEPRKSPLDYEVNENIQARCPGFQGVHPGTIVAIDEDRDWLKKMLNEPRPIKNNKRNKETVKEDLKTKAVVEKPSKTQTKGPRNKKESEKKPPKTSEERVVSMLEMAKSMPFTAAANNIPRKTSKEQTVPISDESSEEEDDVGHTCTLTDSHESSEEEDMFSPLNYQNKVEENRNKNISYLQSIGLTKFREDVIGKKKKENKTKRVRPATETLNEAATYTEQPRRKRKINFLPPMDLEEEELDASTQESVKQKRNPLTPVDPKEWGEESNLEHQQRKDDVEGDSQACCCTKCPHLERVKELEKLLEQRQPSSSTTVQKAGIYTPEEAAERKMIELVPKTNVYMPIKNRTIIFGSAATRVELAAKLMRTFFTRDQLRAAGQLANLNPIIIETIIACCLRIKDLPDVDTKNIKKAMHNVISYAKRDQQNMITKMKEKRERNKEEKQKDSELTQIRDGIY